MGEVAIKVWIRERSAGRIASAALSISLSKARARLQTVDSLMFSAMALTASTADQELFYPSPTGQNTVSGAGAKVTQNTRAPVIGFAVWERNITADASMNFGRAIDHSYGQSSGGW